MSYDTWRLEAKSSQLACSPRLAERYSIGFAAQVGSREGHDPLTVLIVAAMLREIISKNGFNMKTYCLLRKGYSE